jgi:[ribosomal protein S5]-alanine N-acetyltransferase
VDLPALDALPARLESGRLRLILVTLDDAAAMREGRRDERWHPQYPRPDDVAAVGMVRTGRNSFGPRHVVLDRLAVGTITCHAPPEVAGPELEVGFGLVPDVRGQGVATEALLAYAAAVEALGLRLRGAARPDNRASLRVLAKAGFTELRGSDEDGHLVMARPAPR